MESLPPFSYEARNLQRGVYRHYKGGEYEVTGVARHSETLEEMVVYVELYGEGETWVRPLEMFIETVEVDGEPCPRFEYIDTPDAS